MFRIRHCNSYFLVIVCLQLCSVNVLVNNSNPIENQLKQYQEMIMDRERPFLESRKTKRGLLIDRITFHERRFKYWPDQSRKNKPDADRELKAKKMEKGAEKKKEFEKMKNRSATSH